jgi:hypothetical protein
MSRDPGWRPALTWRVVVFGLFPAAALTSRFASGPLLVRMRTLWLSSVLTILYLLQVTSIVVRGQHTDGPSWWWPLQIGYSAFSIGLILWARRKPLDMTDEVSLRKSLIAAFMLGYALTMTPAVVGFVGCFIVGGLFPLLLGVALFAVALVLNAPTKVWVERRQADLHRQGSSRSLLDVLESGA